MRRFWLRKRGAWLSRLLLRAPEPCYGHHRPSVPVAWNVYRCPSCGARREPERAWHRLIHRLIPAYNPFGRP